MPDEPPHDAPDRKGLDTPEVFTAYHQPGQRQAIAAALTTALRTAGPDFGKAVRVLEQAAAGADPYRVMAAMTFYLGSSRAGTNPEFDRPLGIFQHDLEIAQAALFRQTGPVREGTPSSRVQTLASAIKDFGHAWMLLQMQKVERARDDEARQRERLLAQLRVRASINRSWGYQSRMDAMLAALLDPLSAAVQELGFAPGDLPVLWHNMRETVTKRMNAHIADLRAAREWPIDETWVERLESRFGRLDPAPSGGWAAAAEADANVRDFYLVNCADLKLPSIFRFTIDEITELWPRSVEPEVGRRVISAWAATPSEYREINFTKLPLDNLVMTKPLIANDDDSWHMFCGWIPLHNPFQLIEAALEGHGEVEELYRQRRATFLELRVAELLTAALPEAFIEHSVQSVDPRDGKEYENDVVALVSSFAIVAEAKSGGLHPDARFGKPAVLKDRVHGLVVDPSDQAIRLAQVLERATSEISFRRRADGSSFSVDAAEVRRTLTVAVTLEPIADMLPRLAEVAEMGLSAETADALSYNINILDLEVVIDVLDHPSEVLHYLARRSEIEQRLFLGGDEVDLLGLYLQTGFNLGEREFAGDTVLDVTGMSDPIDVWHYKTEAGMPAEKPKSDRIDWWERILSRIEERAGDRWAEIGVTLCNVAPPEQHEFKLALEHLRDEIVAGTRDGGDLVSFLNGPPQRQDLFVGVLAASAERDERLLQYQEAASSAMDHTGKPRAILLALAPVVIAEPYFAMCVFDAPEESR